MLANGSNVFFNMCSMIISNVEEKNQDKLFWCETGVLSFPIQNYPDIIALESHVL